MGENDLKSTYLVANLPTHLCRFSTSSSICLAQKFETCPVWVIFERVTSGAHKDTSMVYCLRLSCTPANGRKAGPVKWTVA